MVFSIIFSQTLDLLQRSDIGLYFYASDRSVSSKIGVISEFPQKQEKHHLLYKVLKITDREFARD